MNLDEQKSNWQQQNRTLSVEYFGAAEVVDKAMDFEKRLARRDLFEAIAAVIVVGFFGSVLLAPDSLELPILSRIGIIVTMLSVTSAVVTLYWTRLCDDKPAPDTPTLDFCQAEIRRVDRQIRLLRRITLWYSWPMLLGAMMITTGFLIFMLWEIAPVQFVVFLFAFNLCFVAAGIVIHRGGKRDIKTKLLPFREGLYELTRALEEDE